MFISSFLGVGNRPIIKKKNWKSPCAQGAWLQARLNHVLREEFQEKVAFSVVGQLENFFISKSIEVLQPVVGADFKTV